MGRETLVRREVDRVVVVLLLLAAALRFRGLGTHSLWFDEAWSGLIAQLSAAQVLTNAAGSSHPPGYYFLLHLWCPLGRSEFVLRFPSAWFSLAAVALVARLSHDLFGRRVARLAALGMALAPFQVYYAQEARMYGLAIALSAGILWAFLQGVRGGSRGAWWVYSVFTALGLYVHYYIALVVLALHLWLLLDRGHARQASPTLLVADGLAVLAFAPQLAQFRVEAGEFLSDARWRVVPSPLEPLRTLHYLLFGHIMPLWIVPLGLFLTLSLLAFGVLWIWRRRDTRAGVFLLVVLIPVVAVLIVSLSVTPVYVERSFAVVTPALMVLLARGIAIVPRRSPMPYLGTALAALMVVGTALHCVRVDPAKPPIRQAVAAVVHEMQATDVVLHLQDASYLSALYYEPGQAGALVDAGQRLWLTPEMYALLGGRVVRSDDLALVDRVWLVVMPGYLDPPQQVFLNAWEADHPPLRSRDWGMVQVRLYDQGEER
jgi:mannosyltransferase